MKKIIILEDYSILNSYKARSSSIDYYGETNNVSLIVDDSIVNIIHLSNEKLIEEYIRRIDFKSAATQEPIYVISWELAKRGIDVTTLV